MYFCKISSRIDNWNFLFIVLLSNNWKLQRQNFGELLFFSTPFLKQPPPQKKTWNQELGSNFASRNWSSYFNGWRVFIVWKARTKINILRHFKICESVPVCIDHFWTVSLQNNVIRNFIISLHKEKKCLMDFILKQINHVKSAYNYYSASIHENANIKFTTKSDVFPVNTFFY